MNVRFMQNRLNLYKLPEKWKMDFPAGLVFISAQAAAEHQLAL